MSKTRSRIAGLLAALLLLVPAHLSAAETGEAGTIGASAVRVAEASQAAAPEAVKPKAHIVSLGLWGLQNLFRTEASQAAAVMQTYYGRGGPVVVKANTPTAAVVTTDGVRAALANASAQMDREHDLLV